MMKAFRIIEFDKLDSTSKYMKENLDRLSVFDVVTSHVQTNGYGRMQREWYDNVDNLSFSLYLEFPTSEKNGLLAQVMALSVSDFLMSNLEGVSIKWPNDCLVNGKKIAGILVENIIKGNSTKMIVGIGININNKSFIDELSTKATSMYIESSSYHDKKFVLKEVLNNIEKYLGRFVKGDYSFMDKLRARSSVIGKEVHLFEGEKVLVKDIDQLGRLVVQTGKEIKAYSGSEISLEKIY